MAQTMETKQLMFTVVLQGGVALSFLLSFGTVYSKKSMKTI